MRARLAIYAANLQVEQREIVFWDKPQPMLTASPKGTVPVLVLANGTVIEESLDIMLWALSESDSNGCYQTLTETQKQLASEWIDVNDNDFKPLLDAYKYADKYSEFTSLQHRNKALWFLEKLENTLAKHQFLLGEKLSYVDYGLCPFIRQFVNVDTIWRDGQAVADYPYLMKWLDFQLNSEAFKQVMKNRPVWEVRHQPLMVIEPVLQTKNEFIDKALCQ